MGTRIFNYEIIYYYELQSSDTCIQFHDYFSVVDYLRNFQDDPFIMHELRSYAAEDFYTCLPNWDNEIVINQVAWKIITGEIIIIEYQDQSTTILNEKSSLNVKSTSNDKSVKNTQNISTNKEKTETDCSYTPLEKVVAFIHKRMLENLKSETVSYIRNKFEFWQWENFLIPFKYEADMIQAYYQWYIKVKNGADWDYKEDITEEFGSWACDKNNKIIYNFDIWSNIHYGYIGLATGFPKWDLLAGAGVAQARANTVPDGYWKRRLEVLGDADFLAAFDDPKDQEAIKIGFNLWEEDAENIKQNDILAKIRANQKLNKKACDKHGK